MLSCRPIWARRHMLSFPWSTEYVPRLGVPGGVGAGGAVVVATVVVGAAVVVWSDAHTLSVTEKRWTVNADGNSSQKIEEYKEIKSAANLWD